jgi:hypothetical protein
MTLAMLLEDEEIEVLMFSAQVSLLPFLGWLLAQDQFFPSVVKNLVDVKVASWVLNE